MKKIINMFMIATVLTLTLSSCGEPSEEQSSVPEINKSDNTVNSNIGDIVVTDSTGKEFIFENSPKKVVTLGASLTDLWLSAGGEIVGTSVDSFDREDLNISTTDIVNVGGYNNINVEEVIKLEPELVIFAPNIKGQEEVAPTLEMANIPVFYADVQSFDDYLEILKTFSEINKNEDAYKNNGLEVEASINNFIELASGMEDTTGLFLRSSASVLKVLPQENFQITIMEDMGIKNIAENNQGILDDMSIEAILKEDPYYIFFVVMGDESGKEKLDEYILQNPSWNELTAVKEGRFIQMPKELFHNKPNSRWGEAYEQIYNIRRENEQ